MTGLGWQLMAVSLAILCCAQWLAIYLLGRSLDDERDLVEWYRERAAKKNSEMLVLRNELLSIKEGLPNGVKS